MRRRTYLLWGIIPLTIALIFVLREFEVLPEGLFDLLTRAWPVVIVLVGLVFFLRRRVAYAGLIALVLSIALGVGLSVLAYASRENQVRDDQQVSLAQEVDQSVSLLVVNISMLSTDVEIIRAADDSQEVSGEFVGSTESEISFDYEDRGDGTAEVTLREDKPAQFPLLEAMGRGRLRLQIPVHVGVAIAFKGENGAVTFNMSDLQLERLDIELERGDILMTLPVYEPRSPNASERPGQIITANGTVTVFAPPTVAVYLELNRGGNDIRPQFDSTYILIDDGADGTIEKRIVAETDIPLYYEITAPRGLIRLETSGAG